MVYKASSRCHFKNINHCVYLALYCSGAGTICWSAEGKASPQCKPKLKNRNPKSPQAAFTLCCPQHMLETYPYLHTKFEDSLGYMTPSQKQNSFSLPTGSSASLKKPRDRCNETPQNCFLISTYTGAHACAQLRKGTQETHTHYI